MTALLALGLLLLLFRHRLKTLFLEIDVSPLCYPFCSTTAVSTANESSVRPEREKGRQIIPRTGHSISEMSSSLEFVTAIFQA